MKTPHIGQIIELCDGTRAMVYRIKTTPDSSWGICTLYNLSTVTSTGEKVDVYV